MTTSPDPQGTQRTSPTRLPGWITRPLSRVYAHEIGRRNQRFDRGIGVERIDRPVISVGNLSAGGTGKTPMVRWVVQELQRMGHHPAIAMRGYKAKPGAMSDEQAEHAEAMPGVPIVAQADRIAGLRTLFASEAGREIDCVVLDDGFQHRRLARDLDIVLIDATRPAHEDALLPCGFLREGMGSLSRAGAVVITRADSVGEERIAEIERSIAGYIGTQVPVVRAIHQWDCLRWFGGPDDPSTTPVGAIEGRRLFVCAAIGNPEAFVASVEREGAEVCGRLLLNDHAAFDQAAVARVREGFARSGGDAICVTAKDWVKLRSAMPDDGGLRVVVPDVAMEISPFDGLSERLSSVFSDQ